MSKESLEWLSNNTLIGFTDKRGNAWHHRKGDSNTYPGPIPVEAVERRLFAWDAVQVPECWEHDGKRYSSDTDSVVIRSDTGAKLGTFRNSYRPHQYREWLVGNVAAILDDDLMIGSAGLLRGGAVAWVQVEMPDNIETPQGVSFRPFLLARTSFDGSLSTTYGRAVTNVVCDNTMAVAANEHGGQQVKVRHSSKSLERLASVRDALGVVYDTADAFAAEVAALAEVKITDHVFDKIVDEIAPLDPEAKRPGQTIRKRETLHRLWTSDERVSPWRGTALGAWQAFNTYGQHEVPVRGMTRQERNMIKAVDGSIGNDDADTREVILAMA